jgi:regulator of protease activity HflC (stomatin/prohibitin superfamily)
MRRKLDLVALVLSVILAFVLTGCGKAVRTGTSTGDYVSPSLQTREYAADPGLGAFLFAASGALSVAAYLALPKVVGRVRIVVAVVLFLVLVSAVLLAASQSSVDGGEIGVIVAQGKPVRLAYPGAHWLVPYWEKLVVFPTRNWTFITMSNPIEHGSEDYRTYPMGVTTRDGVRANIRFSVIGSLDPARAIDVYAKYGTLENAIVQAVKSPCLVIIRKQTQEYNAIDLVTAVDAVEEVVMAELLPYMEQAGLNLVLFGFRGPDLGEFGTQLNAERVAEQRAVVAQKEIAETEAQAQKRVAEAEGQRQVTILKAEADAQATLAQQKAEADAALYRAQQDAEAAKIAADAEAYQILAKARAEAEGNDLIAASLTPEFITYTQWQQWDGRLPSTVMGGATGEPVVTLPLPPQ